MSFEKENFLRTKLISYLQRLNPSTPPKWGKMNVQQMIEHLNLDAVQIASGKIKWDKPVTPPERLQKMKEFLLSERTFKENTVNPLLEENPAPTRFQTVQAAISDLHMELIYFFEVFDKNPSLYTLNPIFGDLNFDQNVQLLYKHAQHHLRQFGVVV